MSAVLTPGPGRPLTGPFQTLIHVAPPSIVTSTSATSPKPVEMKSFAHWMAAFKTPERSMTGVMRYVSSKEKEQLLLTIAYGPEPPVRLPSKKLQGSGPSVTTQLSPDSVWMLQPGGRTPASKLSERIAGP